jgi:acetyltransferase-like isoleucine patch superfamily enzyme
MKKIRVLLYLLLPTTYLSLLRFLFSTAFQNLQKMDIYYRKHPFMSVNKWGKLKITHPENIHIGKGTSVHNNVDLYADKISSITIGKNSKIGQRTQLVSTRNDHLKIGQNTSFHSDCSIVGQVTIGDNCLFARHIFISSYEHTFKHIPYEYIKKQDLLHKTKSPVSIADDCWIGWGVAIKSGIKIGKGAIVGANSVVTKNIPPYKIYGGIPAKEIGTRLEFKPPTTINSLNHSHSPYFYHGLMKINDHYQNHYDAFSIAAPKNSFTQIDIHVLEPTGHLILTDFPQILPHLNTQKIIYSFKITAAQLKTEYEFYIIDFKTTDLIRIKRIDFIV